MSELDPGERTVGGLVGKVVGKTKEVLGGATENDDLEREGRLQQVQAEAGLEAQATDRAAQDREARGAIQERAAESEAERERLSNEVAAQQREDQIERDRQAAENRAEAQAADERRRADEQLQNETRQANEYVDSAEQDRITAAQEANRLDREAHEAERRAENLDPTENQ